MAGGVNNFANLPLKTDSNGYLLVTIGGGNWTPTLISIPQGTAAAPTLVILGDIQSGIYQRTAGTFNIGIGGNNTFEVAAAVVSIGNGAALSLQGKISKYANVTTTGQGVPSIYGSGAVAATTGAIASLATYTVGASNAEFDIAGHVDVNTATTHAFTMVANYTDPAGVTRAQTLSFMLVAGGALVTVVTAANGTVPYNGVPQRIRCKATTAITILTTGTLTTVNYDANASIIQIN